MVIGTREILNKFSEDQGWNEESEIIHLCGFLNELANEEGENQFPIVAKFQLYLEAIQKEENAVEAVCETCGKPCEYDSEICLCGVCDPSDKKP